MFKDSISRQTVFTPSDLSDLLACEHLFAQKLRQVNGERQWPQRAEDSLVQKKGAEHEAAYLSALKAAGLNVVEIEEERADWTKSLAATRAAIEDPTVDVVYQAHLAKGDWRGRADFLERIADTGSFEVIDTKLARSVKPKMVLQLCFYSDALAELQGVMPEHMHVVLGDNTRETLCVSDFIHYYRAAVGRLEQRAASNGHVDTYPWPVEHCANCELADECEERRRADDHLTLVAGVSRGLTQRLQEAGVATGAQLARASPDARPPSISPVTFEKVRRQAALQQEPEPGTWELLEPTPGKGFARLPEPDPGDLFYDIEGDPLWDADGSLEYLHGVWYLPKPDTPIERAVYSPFWAHNRVTERSQFERLIHCFVERLEQFPGMHIYHYAPYETTAIKRLAQHYGTCEHDVDELLRRGVFVDLLRVVTQSLQASVENYSLKSMEKFYMAGRSALVKKGDDSIEEYERWRETSDQSILDEIETYNKEDCKSTYLLREWLLARREEAFERWGREVVMREEEEEAPDDVAEMPELKRERLQLFDSLKQRAETARMAGDGETADVLALTAELLRYHQREHNAGCWDVFARGEMSGDELERDREAIAGLVPLNADSPVPDARSFIYEFEFPVQEYKFKPGDTPLDPETLEPVGTIVALNDEKCRVSLKRGPKFTGVELPKALIPGWPLHTYAQQDAVARFARSLRDDPTGDSYPALRGLLRREPPLGGASLQRDSEEERAALPDATYGNYLLVQGPPGTGKTYIGARMIVRLLRDGKRVGVTATGHEVIHNLLGEVEDVAAKQGYAFTGIKKCDKAKEHTRYVSKNGHGFIANESDNAAVHASGAAMVAGTAWLFSREEWGGELDYIFIDEAGQMSLADTIAVGTAARSLVMLGDPAQLPQVIKASHPDGAGASAMEHVLGEHATVPPELGLFLETTHRLHPDICDFIGETFYESRLRPDAKTAGHVTAAGAGLRFLPVEHSGRSHRCEEEADAIADEIDRLRDAGVRPDPESDTDDIIVVAPYNAQVDLIKQRVPHDVKVGTVDRFQGKQAQVVFYSLTASSRDDVPRGLDFLFAAPRLNVAISRAKALAYLVGSPAMIGVDARTVAEMRLANGVCGLVERAGANR